MTENIPDMDIAGVGSGTIVLRPFSSTSLQWGDDRVFVSKMWSDNTYNVKKYE